MFYPLACLLDASKTIVAESQRSGRANREMESPRFTPKPNLFVSTIHSLRQKTVFSCPQSILTNC